jgi:hypothetical protein
MHENQTKGVSILLLLFLPLIGLFSGLKYLSWPNKRVIIVLFFILYGSLLQYGEGTDASVYYDLLELYQDMGFNQFFLWLKHILIFQPLPQSPNDVYVHVLAFLTSSLLGMKGLFFPIVAGIYGYLYAIALSKIVRWERGKHITITILMVVMLFIIHRSITNFQTVRTWTGMWLLFNGVLGYYQTKERKYIIMMLCSPIIHFAYFVIAIPAFLSLYFRKLPSVFLIVLYFASFIVTIDFGMVSELSQDNKLAEKKVRSYYRENEYGEGIDPIREKSEDSGASWYAKYGKTDAIYYGGHAFAVFLILAGFYKKRMTEVEAGLITTGLLLATMANFGSFSYAFYSRTMANAVTYILATVVLINIRDGFRYKPVLNPMVLSVLQWICILIFLPKMLFFVADFFVSTSIYIIALPFVGWLSESTNISIREFIGQFL